MAAGRSTGGIGASDILLPVAYNILALFLGFFCGYFLSRLLIPSRSKDNRLINNFTPPVMSLFFILSGMKLDVAALATVGVIGVCYFLIRIIGKYLGTFISCSLMKTSKEIRNYMGLALIPQAGPVCAKLSLTLSGSIAPIYPKETAGYIEAGEKEEAG